MNKEITEAQMIAGEDQVFAILERNFSDYQRLAKQSLMTAKTRDERLASVALNFVVMQIAGRKLRMEHFP